MLLQPVKFVMRLKILPGKLKLLRRDNCGLFRVYRRLQLYCRMSSLDDLFGYILNDYNLFDFECILNHRVRQLQFDPAFANGVTLLEVDRSG